MAHTKLASTRRPSNLAYAYKFWRALFGNLGMRLESVFDASNTPGMKDDRASCLLLDSRGDLWAGTYGGTLLKRAGQAFLTQDLGTAAPSRNKESDRAAGKVNALAEDGQGALWLALESMGLLRFHHHCFPAP